MDLKVTKWEPFIPTSHRQLRATGTYGAGNERTVRYDIENVKKYHSVLAEGEQVVFTEKIHGTWCQVGVMAEANAHAKHGRLIVSSKGLASKGIAISVQSDDERPTAYVRVAQQYSIMEAVENYFKADLEG